MAFPLMILALILIVSGVRNTTGALGQMVAKDFSGSKNFFYWLGAIVIVGSIGYVPRAQTASRAFMLLIMVVMVLSDKGFFSQFVQAISSIQPQGASSEQDVGAAQTDKQASSSSGGKVAIGSPLTSLSPSAIIAHAIDPRTALGAIDSILPNGTAVIGQDGSAPDILMGP